MDSGKRKSETVTDHEKDNKQKKSKHNPFAKRVTVTDQTLGISQSTHIKQTTTLSTSNRKQNNKTINTNKPSHTNISGNSKVLNKKLSTQNNSNHLSKIPTTNQNTNQPSIQPPTNKASTNHTLTNHPPTNQPNINQPPTNQSTTNQLPTNQPSNNQLSINQDNQLINQPTDQPSTTMKRLPSSSQALTANVSPHMTNLPNNTASTANTTLMVVNQPIGVASNSNNLKRIQIKDETSNKKVTNLAANEKYRLKRHGLIRISLHGTSVYTEPELRHILTRLHTKNAERVGSNLIVASVKIGNMSHIDKSDTRNISELDEFGPVLDQSTQVNGEEIDDMITTCDMVQWQELTEIPMLVENHNLITSTIKPKDVYFNQKAFFNYTKYSIPEDIGVILSMGPKFAAPVYYNVEDFNLLKEAAFMLNDAYCQIEDRKTVRLNIIEHIRDYQAEQYIEHASTIRDYFNAALKHTNSFLKNHPDIILTQADKARASILMDKTTYINKVENLLKDRSTYTPLKNSSIAAYMKMNEGLLKRLEKAQWTTREKIEEAIESENHAANLYALIKTHKKDTPTRPIVNTRNSPGFLAATLITKILTKARDTHKYNVLNSRKACEKLRDVNIAPDEKFYSFDIVSMFTNIPVDRAIEAVKKRQSKLELNDEQMNLVIDIIKFICLTSTEIMFNSAIYKQIRGLRMGSSLSPILADFVVEDMLDLTFKKIEKPKFLLKYVDDIMTVIEEDKAEDFLAELNSMDTHIKFEMEKEIDQRINYLDVTIFNEGWTPKTKWYQKHISSGQFLNYVSHHSKSNIWNTAVQYVVTMICNSHPDFFEEILETAMDRLRRNSYPEHYAKRVITAAQEKIVQKMGSTQRTANTQMTLNQDKEEGSFYSESLTYIPKLTDKLKKILEENAAKGDNNIQIPLKPTYKMSQQTYNKHKNSNQNNRQTPTNHPANISLTVDETNIDLTQS